MLEGIKTLAREGLLGMRLLWELPSYLKKKIEPAQAEALIKQRLERRSEDFLLIINRCIYDYPKSPYAKLLSHAGCDYGDIQKLTSEEGVEGALRFLFQNGVYFTSKEMRGEREIVRGSLRFRVSPQNLRNPYAKPQIPVRSSGSRSRGTHVIRSLDFAFDNTLHMAHFFRARQILSAEHAIWIVPGGVTLNLLIKLNLAGATPVRWFSQLDPSSQELDLRYKLSTWILQFSGRLAGTPMPKPEFVSLEDPKPIIDWMREQIKKGLKPHLYTLSSSAARLSHRAIESGIDLKGAHFTISGEPATQTRIQTIRRSNAEVLPAMGCVETGTVGYGCLQPAAFDDLHLAKDLHAVIQPEKTDNTVGLGARSLLFSSLRLSSPLILLNVSVGDQATLERRSCGCPLSDIGLDTHLHDIRSFEKLTSGGMAFQDTDVIRILEEDLPLKFGGGPTDYQFQEDEGEDGTPRLRLFVHPAVCPKDENAIKEYFLKKIGKGSGADKITSLLWRTSDMLTVEREVPQTTATGKIQHIHTTKPPKGEGAQHRKSTP